MTSTVQTAKDSVSSGANPEQNEEPQQLTLEVGPMAHGGHCVARHEGRVVFVRHAVPGEVVVAQLTEAGPEARFWRADTVKVISGSEFRRSHQWKLADSLRAYAAGRRPVGGAEYGHIVLEHQRRLKAQVFRDTLQRIGKLSVDVHMEGIPDDEPTGLHWRTRNSFTVNSAGKLAMHVHHSDEKIPVRNIPLAINALDELRLWDVNFEGAERVEVVTPGHGQEALVLILPSKEVAAKRQLLDSFCEKWKKQVERLPQRVSVLVSTRTQKIGKPAETIRLRGRSWVQEHVSTKHHGNLSFRVHGDGFWQIHRAAPQALVEEVMRLADPQPGQLIADLYGGAGLFSAFLAQAVGEKGRVLSVEAAASASRDARRNLHNMEQATVLNGKTDRVLASWLQSPHEAFGNGGLDGQSINTIVLDPPRSGAGKSTIKRISQLAPEKIVYVSCDPASFARDARWLTELGWTMETVKALDLYPDTHHLESVSMFTPRKSG